MTGTSRPGRPLPHAGSAKRRSIKPALFPIAQGASHQATGTAWQ
ncbi:hypothetical protein [Halomonas caseinilytica]|nr:hypothetical protein [Halomonas caseinilytica]